MTPLSLKEKQAVAQKTLLDFLEADLDLCFTMLKTAELTSTPEHYHSALKHVGEGLLIIRRLSGRIEDPEAWKSVHERSDELERDLVSFPSEFPPGNRSTNI
jgi:hypothetical protein